MEKVEIYCCSRRAEWVEAGKLSPGFGGGWRQRRLTGAQGELVEKVYRKLVEFLGEEGGAGALGRKGSQDSVRL